MKRKHIKIEVHKIFASAFSFRDRIQRKHFFRHHATFPLKVFGGEPLSGAVTQVQVAYIHRLALARFNAVLVSNERIKVVFNGSLNANLLVNGWLDWLGRFFGRCRSRSRSSCCCFYNLRRSSFKRFSFRAKFSWTPRFSQGENKIQYSVSRKLIRYSVKL